MGKTLVLTVGGLLTCLLNVLLADKLKGRITWFTDVLLELAVARLPEEQRERFSEEWASHLDEKSGDIGRVIFALGCVSAALEMSSVLKYGTPTFNRASKSSGEFVRNFVKRLFDFRPHRKPRRSPRLPVRVVIADSHPLLRDGLRQLLEAEADFKVIGEATDGLEAVRLARQLKPDILSMELRIPKLNGLDALRELSSPANTAPTRVILLTAAIGKSQVVEALQLGARGVVLKDVAMQVLLKAMQTVMAGEYWMGREPISNLVVYMQTLMQSTHDEAHRKNFGLTPRELETVSAVVAGYSNREIADYLKIGEDNLKRHLSNIFDRLGVSSRLELALFAVHHALPVTEVGNHQSSANGSLRTTSPDSRERGGRVAPEIRVGRYFHFSCSCGAKTITAGSKATCGGCGKVLTAQRVSKRARVPGFSAYYGVAVPAAQPEPAAADQPESDAANDSSRKRRPVNIGDIVRVIGVKPDGVTPHPHSGTLGQVMGIFNGHAHVVVAGEHYGICVSVSCLELAPDTRKIKKQIGELG